MKIFLDANICLDLLDTKRSTSEKSVQWYMNNKDNTNLDFYFSGDFITTFYYVMTQKRKLDNYLVIDAISSLCNEILPAYLTHSDFELAKESFSEKLFDDFEDLMILHSVTRIDADCFITNDRALLSLKKFHGVKIQNTLQEI